MFAPEPISPGKRVNQDQANTLKIIGTCLETTTGL